MSNQDAQTRAQIALGQSKKLERDARQLKQQLAAILEDLQDESPQGEQNGSAKD